MSDHKHLFREFALESEESFCKIFDLYKQRVYYTAIRLLKEPALAEEIVQDVFMAVWSNRSKFLDIEDPEAYLFTITYNRINAQLKKTARDNKFLSYLLSTLKPYESPEEQLIVNENSAIINKAIENLSPQRKLIFKLSRVEGLTHQQIAKQLNISHHTVRNQIIQAIRQVRSFLNISSMSVFLLNAIRIVDQLTGS